MTGLPAFWCSPLWKPRRRKVAAAAVFKTVLDTTVSTVYTVHIQKRNGGDAMQLFIDNRCGDPIYEQICAQIKRQIMSGELREDELLPSIRNLAKDLRISVVTTKRAYDELEREGFLYTVAGKGCFVAPKNLELLREEQMRAVEAHLQEALRLGAQCGLSGADVAEMLAIIAGED